MAMRSRSERFVVAIYEGGHMTAVWWEGTAPMVHPTTKPRYC